MIAARSAPRSEPAKSYDFRPKARPRSARSAALEEPREGRPAREHVIDGLSDGIVPGELGAFRARPLFERSDERRGSSSNREADAYLLALAFERGAAGTMGPTGSASATVLPPMFVPVTL